MRGYGPAPPQQGARLGIWPLAIVLFLLGPHLGVVLRTAAPGLTTLNLTSLKLPNLQAVARPLSAPPRHGRAAHAGGCPVQGRVRFANDWHAPRVGHLHQGNDLFAAHGTPVAAVERGTVGRVGYAGIGGLRVWLLGRSGNAYYYAHLSAASVRSGQKVNRGARLGQVGNTGNAANTPSHLHFEIHPGGGQAVNPYPSVRRWC